MKDQFWAVGRWSGCGTVEDYRCTILTPACLVLAEIEGPNNAKNKTILKQLSKAENSM